MSLNCKWEENEHKYPKYFKYNIKLKIRRAIFEILKESLIVTENMIMIDERFKFIEIFTYRIVDYFNTNRNARACNFSIKRRDF